MLNIMNEQYSPSQHEQSDSTPENGIAYTLMLLCILLVMGSLLTVGGALLLRILFHMHIMRNTLDAVSATVAPLMILSGFFWLIGKMQEWKAQRTIKHAARQQQQQQRIHRAIM